MQYHWIHASIGSVTLAALAMIGCNDDEPSQRVGNRTHALTVRAECIEEGGPPAGGWICGEERVVECRERDAPDAEEVLFVDPDTTCDAADLSVEAGPYGLGTHEITVVGASPDGGDPSTLCTATLTVVDTLPPEATSMDSELWPPNHEMRAVSIEDCVTITDACAPAVDVHFLWATSDEPADARGDGHHQPDMQFASCGSLELRAERQGGGDGRVYQLGWEAIDASGNAMTGVCHVTVPHDQGDEVEVGEPNDGSASSGDASSGGASRGDASSGGTSSDGAAIERVEAPVCG